MYVFMYVYKYMCIYICMFMCTYICTYKNKYILYPCMILCNCSLCLVLVAYVVSFIVG